MPLASSPTKKWKFLYEIALALAMSEHDFGDRAAAKEMYQRVMALKLKGKIGLVRASDLTGAGDLPLEPLALQAKTSSVSATRALR